MYLHIPIIHFLSIVLLYYSYSAIVYLYYLDLNDKAMPLLNKRPSLLFESEFESHANDYGNPYDIWGC